MLSPGSQLGWGPGPGVALGLVCGGGSHPSRADAGTLASSVTQGRTFWQPGLGDQYWAGKSWEVLMLFSWTRGFLCALSGLGPSEVPAKF